MTGAYGACLSTSGRWGRDVKNISKAVGLALAGATIAAAPAHAVTGEVADSKRSFYGPGGCRVDVAMAIPSAGQVQGWMLYNGCGGSATLQLQRNGVAKETHYNIITASWATNNWNVGSVKGNWRACVIARASGCSGNVYK